MAALGITHVGEVHVHPPRPLKARSITGFIARVELKARRFAIAAAWSFLFVGPIICLWAHIDITNCKAAIELMKSNMMVLGPDPFGYVSRQARDWQIINITSVVYITCLTYLYVMYRYTKAKH